MRPLLLPGLLDAARHNAAHGAADAGAVRVRARVRARAATLDAPEGSPRGRDARRPSATTWRRCSPWRARHLAQRAAAGDFYAAKGLVEARRRRGAAGARRRAPSDAAVPASRAGRRACSAGGERARLDRRAASAGRARLGPRGRAPRSSWTSTRWPQRRRSVAHFADVTSFPAVLPGHRGGGAGGRERRRGRARPSREAGGELLDRRRGLRRLRGRAGGGGQPLAGAAAGVPRARPHAHRRRGRRARAARSRPRWPRSEGSSVARVAVVGAAGFGGALCAGIVQRHPSLELTAVTARTDAGQAPRRALPASTGST